MKWNLKNVSKSRQVFSLFFYDKKNGIPLFGNEVGGHNSLGGEIISECVQCVELMLNFFAGRKCAPRY